VLESGRRTVSGNSNLKQRDSRPPRTSGAPEDATAFGRIGGPDLWRAFEGATAALGAQRDAINAINVFPVPDGDTGTNMWMTMRAAVEAVTDTDAQSATAVARAAARGALMGAKGNSGVILSQILAGFAAIPGDDPTLDAPALAAALRRACEAAYKVVSAPKEGTILTAITAAAEGAAAARDSDAIAALQAATLAAQDAVARTPELLPVLKEAGVVDSGAEGLYVALDGMLRALRGEAVAPAADLGSIDASWLSATRQVHHEGEAAGFCTEFVVEGAAIDADLARSKLGGLGDSLLVVGGGDLLRVHLHTAQPGAALDYARSLGTLLHEKVDDMQAQMDALAERDALGASSASVGPNAGVGVVAVAAGAGLEALFASLGATVVRGGQTMNPSAGDIVAAIERSAAADVIVLPNNKNIVLAAKQAASALPGRRVHVIETRSVPAGVAALVARNEELSRDENLEAMQEAAAAVRAAEVTLAARGTRVNGIDVREGQPIGIVQGDLTVAEDTLPAAVMSCVRQLASDGGVTLVTLYAGSDANEDETASLADAVRETFGVEVEVVAGGQPHYPYLIGAE
jgi:DAK2 domain fusion protein YloV